MANRQTSGRLSRILTNLRKGFRRQTEKCVGEDEHGNRYYEKLGEQRSKNLSQLRRVEPLSKDIYEVPKVPSEWMTWLQGRRIDPPTDEERMRNYATLAKTLKGAKELQDQRKEEDSQRDSEKAREVSALENETKFPKYEDYEAIPGVKPRLQKEDS